MKKLPLNEVHKSLGADFAQNSGCSVPQHYGDTEAEYTAVREGVGIIDLSSRGKLRLSGKDHLKFLQGMLTNDVLKLKEGSGVYATILTVKGRMVSDMRVYRENESVLLDLEPGMNEKVKDLLTKFRLSYKADIEDITETTGLISVQGPYAAKLIALFIERELPPMDQYDFLQLQAIGLGLTIVSVNRTGEQGFDIYINNDGLELVWESLMSKGKELDIKPVGYDALNTLRIEAGIPVYGVDMDENNIPIEAGLWDALDFEKGCYVGQEVVARIKWRGHVNWHLMGFAIEGSSAPEVGNEVFSGERKIGRITSSTLSPAFNKPLSLGYIRREFREEGTHVSINMGGNSQEQAEVRALPFYKGSFNIENNSANS